MAEGNRKMPSAKAECCLRPFFADFLSVWTSETSKTTCLRTEVKEDKISVQKDKKRPIPSAEIQLTDYKRPVL